MLGNGNSLNIANICVIPSGCVENAYIKDMLEKHGITVVPVNVKYLEASSAKVAKDEPEAAKRIHEEITPIKYTEKRDDCINYFDDPNFNPGTTSSDHIVTLKEYNQLLAEGKIQVIDMSEESVDDIKGSWVEKDSVEKMPPQVDKVIEINMRDNITHALDGFVCNSDARGVWTIGNNSALRLLADNYGIILSAEQDLVAEYSIGFFDGIHKGLDVAIANGLSQVLSLMAPGRKYGEPYWDIEDNKEILANLISTEIREQGIEPEFVAEIIRNNEDLSNLIKDVGLKDFFEELLPEQKSLSTEIYITGGKAQKDTELELKTDIEMSK